MRKSAMLLIAVALAGCGGSSKSSATPAATKAAAGPATTLKLAADKSALKFDKTSLTAPAGKVTIVIEAYSQWRQIFTDGRKHPEDPDLTFNGHSIGHWEGDTLVVDTVGFTTDTALAGFGVKHSDKMHIVERMHLVDGDKLQIETTITDTEALTKPLTSTRVYGRHRDWTLAEYQCQQNNRNCTTDDGKAGINLKH